MGNKSFPFRGRRLRERVRTVVDNAGPYRIQEGTVVVITEGPRPVGYFHVEEVD